MIKQSRPHKISAYRKANITGKKIMGLIALALILSLLPVGLVQAQDPEPETEPPPTMLGRVEGSGTHFEVTDSEYLNVTLDSSEPISLALESVPNTIIMEIEAAAGAASTQINIGSLAANTTYYKHQNGDSNSLPLTTDANGSYTYTQDLSQAHLVLIQPGPSTKYINITPTGGDCTSIGAWNGVTNTCTLTQNVNESIVIQSSNITLDGNGHTLTGSGYGVGVEIDNAHGVTVKNLSISNFSEGIFLYYTNFSTVTGNIVTGNYSGIRLSNSDSNTLANNTVSGNTNTGIALSFSEANAFIGNTASGHNNHGIYLAYYSNYNTLTGNTASGNGHSGIYLTNHAYYNTLAGNTTDNNAYGIFLYIYADNTTLAGNTVSNSTYRGIQLWYSGDHTLANNIATDNVRYGIFISTSAGNTLANNTFSGSLGGIYVSRSSNNNLTGNVVTGNRSGISLQYSSNDNTLIGNTMSYATDYYGLYIVSSNNNQAYNNNFIDNPTQIRIIGSSGNVFNLAAPVGGNYYSNFDTPAEGCSDTTSPFGFCDAPFYFSGGPDYLPWTMPNGWANRPPRADAFELYTGYEGSPILLDGRASTDDSGIALYEWDCTGDGTYDVSSASPTGASCTYPDNGSFTVRLRVTDSDGVTDEDTTTVDVYNVVPTAIFGNTGPVTSGNSFTLSLTGPSDPSPADTSTGFTYAFDCDDGSGYGPFSASNSTTCPAGANGIRTVKGKIRDKDGGVNEYAASVLVDITNQPPVADAGVFYSGDEGSPIALDGSGSLDPDGDPLSYAWSVDSTLCTFDDASIASPQLTCADNGSFTATLSVDDGQATDSDTASVAVTNVAPTLGAIGVSPTVVEVGTSVNSNASFSDPAGVNDESYICNFDYDGDGSIDDTVRVSSGGDTCFGNHSYATPGIYTVRLTVTDKDLADSNESVFEYVVVYDPDGGFVTGGGWIIPGSQTSDPGDLLPELDGSSKANFGFVVKYQNGAATVPGGNLEFHYNAGGFHLHSADMEWLVVTNQNWAKFQGTATIDGMAGLYPFKVDARDADTDRFVIKIYAPGADPDVEEPIYKASGDLEGGQIKIHRQ